MAITVKKLVKNAARAYKMELLAGEEGLSNLVEWAHVVEDIQVSLFLHGQELIFTVGAMNTGTDWLLQFVGNLHAMGASAFVINLGPYIKEVPKEVIAFCDQVSLPLFTIPWEIRLVDVTRDFCHKILMNDNIEASVAITIQNLIFKVGDQETQILQLERYGYRRDSRFLFVCISIREEEGTEKYETGMRELKRSAEKIARGIRDLYVSFKYQDKLILTLTDYTDEEVQSFAERFRKDILKKQLYSRTNIGISDNVFGLEIQEKNFQNAFLTNGLARKKHELMLQYRDLDVYKVLMSVGNRQLLQEFYDKTLSKLEAYDQENGTELMRFLRIYLDNNTSPQLVSEKMYIHRNTVNNMVQKIERIVGLDLGDLEGKVKYYLAFYIEDIL